MLTNRVGDVGMWKGVRSAPDEADLISTGHRPHQLFTLDARLRFMRALRGCLKIAANYPNKLLRTPPGL